MVNSKGVGTLLIFLHITLPNTKYAFDHQSLNACLCLCLSFNSKPHDAETLLSGLFQTSHTVNFVHRQNYMHPLPYIGMVVHTCNTSIWEDEAGRLPKFKTSLRLHSEFQNSLSYSERSCF